MAGSGEYPAGTVADSLEERVTRLEERQANLIGLVNGGNGVEWRHSLRGRVHELRNSLATADALREALHEVRKERQHLWHTWRGRLLIAAAIATAAAPYVTHYLPG